MGHDNPHPLRQGTSAQPISRLPRAQRVRSMGGRDRRNAQRRAPRVRRRPDHRAGTPAGRTIPDRRVRPLPRQCRRQTQGAQISLRDLGSLYRARDQRRHNLPRRGICRSARATAPGHHRALHLRARRQRAGAVLECAEQRLAAGWQPGAIPDLSQRAGHSRSQPLRRDAR